MQDRGVLSGSDGLAALGVRVDIRPISVFGRAGVRGWGSGGVVGIARSTLFGFPGREWPVLILSVRTYSHAGCCRIKAGHVVPAAACSRALRVSHISPLLL